MFTCSDDWLPTLALNEAVRELAASTLLLNPNRHRASEPTKLTDSANRNSVESNMRRKHHQPGKPKKETKTVIDSKACS
jgi:hypothetical protein